MAENAGRPLQLTPKVATVHATATRSLKKQFIPLAYVLAPGTRIDTKNDPESYDVIPGSTIPASEHDRILICNQVTSIKGVQSSRYLLNLFPRGALTDLRREKKLP